MKALIFAAGLGTRLKPWTDFHPKALAPVGGRPMLGRVIEKLKGCGIREFVVNVHHFADQIADYLRQQDNLGVDITLSDESDLLLDTGGGLLYARRLLGGSEPVLIHNADILTDFDLGAMQSHACASGAMATLLVKERHTQRYLAFDSAGRMRGWRNLATGQVRPDGADLDGCCLRAFGGVHIVSSEIFDRLAIYNESLLSNEARRDTLDGVCKFSITDFYIDNCHANDFMAYEPATPYNWIDIGKADSLDQANLLCTPRGGTTAL